MATQWCITKPHSQSRFRLKYCNFSHWPNENKRTIMATWLAVMARSRPVTYSYTCHTARYQQTATTNHHLNHHPPQRPKQLAKPRPGNYPLIYGEKPFTCPSVVADHEKCKWLRIEFRASSDLGQKRSLVVIQAKLNTLRYSQHLHFLIITTDNRVPVLGVLV